MKISFFIDHEPIPQPRQRHAVINGQVRNYVPKTHPVVAFKQVARIRAREAHQGNPLDGPLRVNFTFLMPRPARLRWKTKPMTRTWCYSKGRNDFDNLCKSVCDALTGIVWIDDGQIVASSTIKLYAAGDESPGVDVRIDKLS